MFHFYVSCINIVFYLRSSPSAAIVSGTPSITCSGVYTDLPGTHCTLSLPVCTLSWLYIPRSAVSVELSKSVECEDRVLVGSVNRWVGAELDANVVVDPQWLPIE